MKKDQEYDLFVAARDKLGRVFEAWQRVCELRRDIQDLKESLKDAREELEMAEARFGALMNEVMDGAAAELEDAASHGRS